LLKLYNQLLNQSDSEERGLKCKAARLLVHSLPNWLYVHEVTLNSEVYRHLPFYVMFAYLVILSSWINNQYTDQNDQVVFREQLIWKLVVFGCELQLDAGTTTVPET